MTKANIRSLAAPWETVAELGEIGGPFEFGRDSFAGVPAQAPSSRLPARGVSHAFLDAVREVALVAAEGDIDAARSVSKSRWESAREPAGHADLPKADSVRARLKVPHWRTALAVVFEEASSRSRTLGVYTQRAGALGRGARTVEAAESAAEIEELEAALRADDIFDPTEAVPWRDMGVTPEVAEQIIRRALRAVAYRRGESPSGAVYDEEVVQIERERQAQGLPALGFPTSTSILARYDSWVKALAAAGLDAPASYSRPKALPVLVALDACVDEWGILPGQVPFTLWCSACGLSVQNPSGSWTTYAKELRRLRTARGATTPQRITVRQRDCPALPDPEHAAAIKARLGSPDPPVRSRTAEDAYESLRTYAAEHIADGKRASQRHYMDACRRDKRLIWPSALPRLTKKTLTELFREVGL